MAFNERTLMAVEQERYNRIVNRHIVLVGVGGVVVADQRGDSLTQTQ